MRKIDRIETEITDIIITRELETIWKGLPLPKERAFGIGRRVVIRSSPPGKIVIDALGNLGIGPDEFTSEHLRLISDMNQAADLLGENEST